MDEPAKKTKSSESPKKRFTRRRFLKYSAGAVALAAVGSGVDAFLIEPNWLEITHRDLPIRGLGSAWVGTTLVQWTDLHVGRWTSLEDVRKLTRTINALHPDIVALTGDYVSQAKAISQPLTETFRNLRPALGCFAVLGNHDFWTNAPAMIASLESAGVQMLTNTHSTLHRDSQPLAIAGVDDLWAGVPDLTAALKGIDPETPRILLCHNPDYADQMPQDLRIDWMLAGHTHGGQVRLPLIGAPRLPISNRTYQIGFCKGPSCPIYVCRGTGSAPWPVRFRCRPELTVFTLRQA